MRSIAVTQALSLPHGSQRDQSDQSPPPQPHFMISENEELKLSLFYLCIRFFVCFLLLRPWTFTKFLSSFQFSSVVVNHFSDTWRYPKNHRRYEMVYFRLLCQTEWKRNHKQCAPRPEKGKMASPVIYWHIKM